MTVPWQSDDPEVRASTDAWLREQPGSVQERFKTHPLGLYYNKKTPGQVMLLIGYNTHDDGKCCNGAIVAVTVDYNAHLAVERRVNGVPFDDLEPITDHPDVVRQRANDGREGLTAEQYRSIMRPADEVLAEYRKNHPHEDCGDPNCSFSDRHPKRHPKTGYASS